jgi:hypothetical protein
MPNHSKGLEHYDNPNQNQERIPPTNRPLRYDQMKHSTQLLLPELEPAAQLERRMSQIQWWNNNPTADEIPSPDNLPNIDLSNSQKQSSKLQQETETPSNTQIPPQKRLFRSTSDGDTSSPHKRMKQTHPEDAIYSTWEQSPQKHILNLKNGILQQNERNKLDAMISQCEKSIRVSGNSSNILVLKHMLNIALTDRKKLKEWFLEQTLLNEKPAKDVKKTIEENRYRKLQQSIEKCSKDINQYTVLLNAYTTLTLDHLQQQETPSTSQQSYDSPSYIPNKEKEKEKTTQHDFKEHGDKRENKLDLLSDTPTDFHKADIHNIQLLQAHAKGQSRVQEANLLSPQAIEEYKSNIENEYHKRYITRTDATNISNECRITTIVRSAKDTRVKGHIDGCYQNFLQYSEKDKLWIFHGTANFKRRLLDNPEYSEEHYPKGCGKFDEEINLDGTKPLSHEAIIYNQVKMSEEYFKIKTSIDRYHGQNILIAKDQRIIDILIPNTGEKTFTYKDNEYFIILGTDSGKAKTKLGVLIGKKISSITVTKEEDEADGICYYTEYTYS